MTTLPAQRLYYLDWIRVLAFLLLIFFHSAMPFVRFGWEIKNAEHSVFLDRLIIWLHQWRLPLLFFISGAGVSFSLRKRSVLAFFGERVIRLFLPLLFAMFFTIPLQVYFEQLQKGQIEPGYPSFYPTVWEMVPYPDGTLTWSHMWFVVYLFAFTILLLPLFAFFKIPAVQRGWQRVNGLFRSPLAHLALALPFIGFFFAQYIRWPEQQSLLDDWFLFNTSLTFYALGFLLAGLPDFWRVCEAYRKVFLALAVACALVLFQQFYWNIDLPKQQNERLYLYGFVNGLHIWTIILSAIGFARRYLNHSSPLLAYLTPAVYPFYILHQTVIVAAGYYFVQWNLPIAIKLLLLIVTCFLVIGSLYEFFIRRFWLTRLLYGLKVRKRKEVLETSEVVN